MNLIFLEFGCSVTLIFFFYSTPISDFVVLQQGAQNSCQDFGGKPRIVDRKAKSCFEMHGNQVELVLHGSHEHGPCLSCH
jgi:hypothetical protein